MYIYTCVYILLCTHYVLYKTTKPGGQRTVDKPLSLDCTPESCPKAQAVIPEPLLQSREPLGPKAKALVSTLNCPVEV